jgi:hypothetical protein
MVSNNGGFTTASYAGIDVAQSDVKYTLTLATAAAVSFILRASNNNHYITLAMGNPITLNTFNAGTTTQIASAGVASSTGDVFEITLSGSTITVLKNGTQIISATSTFNQTSTIFGFSGGGSTAARFDSYQVEDLAAGGTNATVTATVATATNSAVAPSISGAASITSIAATSTMNGIAPSVSTQAVITSVAASATAQALAPSIGSPAIVSVTVAIATAAGLGPAVVAIRNVEIMGSIAAALAVAVVPRIRKDGWSSVATTSTTWRESTVAPTIWR